MSYLAPLLTVVLFICGVVVWRLQLVAKRRFEVAEQALTAFYRAADGLSGIRHPFMWGGEIASATAPEGLSEAEERRIRLYNAYVARNEAASSAFAELRAAQILAEIHIGPAAREFMNVLVRARHEVAAAVNALYGEHSLNTAGMNAQDAEEHNRHQIEARHTLFEHRLASGVPADRDKLSVRIDVARAGLEAQCRPFLEDPAWLKKLVSFTALIVRRTN